MLPFFGGREAGEVALYIFSGLYVILVMDQM